VSGPDCPGAAPRIVTDLPWATSQHASRASGHVRPVDLHVTMLQAGILYAR
jgi:hypothetical protein